jgi:hypothetical protein
MRILLTNDDGIHAPGLAVLEKLARSLSDDITVVAPIAEQSGKGRSLTLTEPVRLRQFGEKRWAVTGTPTDAVMIALAEIMKDAKPDLILCGVNRGANLAEDVSYSGTVAAAMEGAHAGIRSIAMSQRYARRGEADAITFDAAEVWGERVLRKLIDCPARRQHARQRQLPADRRRCGAGRPRGGAGAARLRPLAARSSHRSAGPGLLLAQTRPDRAYAGRRDRSRGDRTGLRHRHAAASRPDTSRIARYA